MDPKARCALRVCQENRRPADLHPIPRVTGHPVPTPELVERLARQVRSLSTEGLQPFDPVRDQSPGLGEVAFTTQDGGSEEEDSGNLTLPFPGSFRREAARTLRDLRQAVDEKRDTRRVPGRAPNRILLLCRQTA